jgi:hypothetical protein
MGRRQAVGTLAVLALGLGLPAAAPSRAEEPDFLAVGLGAFDVLDQDAAGELRVEYRSDLRLWRFAPFIGASVTTDGSLYGFGGFGLDVFFGRRLVLTPNAAVGLYEEGDGKDLGGPIEFRTGAELAYRFDDYSRLGVAFHHMSNAGLYDLNTGAETLLLLYSLPLDFSTR